MFILSVYLYMKSPRWWKRIVFEPVFCHYVPWTLRLLQGLLQHRPHFLPGNQCARDHVVSMADVFSWLQQHSKSYAQKAFLSLKLDSDNIRYMSIRIRVTALTWPGAGTWSSKPAQTGNPVQALYQGRVDWEQLFAAFFWLLLVYVYNCICPQMGFLHWLFATGS